MMMAVHLKDPPDPGVLFPSLRTAETPRGGADEEEDGAIFQAVAASLSKYGG